jgi:ribosome-associated protein
MMKKIAIQTDTIQLDQFLKWAGIVDTGGQTKDFLQNQTIYINGAVVKEKRKKLLPDDIVAIKGIGIWQITRQQG